jgi:ADP-ribose pyrophosphatase YjhB (NUDIX family)
MADTPAAPSGTSSDETIHRQNARVILIGPTDRVFLMRITDPEDGHSVWITPGGGLLTGECHEDAARRELLEETGIAVTDLSPAAWIRDDTIRWDGRWWHEVETFFVCRVDRDDVDVDRNFAEPEYRFLSDHRWWSVEEIAAAPDAFCPVRMAELLPPLLAGDMPDRPVLTGP